MRQVDEAIAAHCREFGIELPPTEDELPYSDGEPMESQRHALQATLLQETLRLAWADREDVFIGGNMFVYFDIEQTRGRTFRGPDVFIVLGVPRREHKSWAVWEQGKGPDVVIELLSDSTAAVDKGEKKQVYQDQLRVPEYFWFDPFTAELAGFLLRVGVYVPIEPDSEGRLVSGRLGLLLTTWEGEYETVTARWLRWATADGVILPTSREVAQQERQRADTERRRVDQLEALLARYRERFGEPPESDA